MAKKFPIVEITLERIVGGGQAIGTLESGKKCFVWGALPDETVRAQVTKKKSQLVEATAIEILSPSPDRIAPQDPDSHLSTSPWQMMTFDAEQRYKAALIEEAFELHDIVLPDPITVYSDGHIEKYRNKVEFSWYGYEDEASNQHLDLAFFRRGSKGKIIVRQSVLLPDEIMTLAKEIQLFLEQAHISARSLKTLLIRSDQKGNCVWQLYVKDMNMSYISEEDALSFSAQGGEVIYSNPKSPASVITKRLLTVGNIVLTDTIFDVPFHYATEGFFQVNIPVYERSLHDMKQWILANTPVVDLYSGVGSIGLTIGGDDVTLVEINEHAVREMKRNITSLGRENSARAVLAPSEKALEYINGSGCVIVDPPRAGLHTDVVKTLLDQKPKRIIYLSCNPVTQARDVALLAEAYGIRHHQGYNFFPRTPHIEHLVVLDLK